MAGRNHIYMSTQSQIDANRINATKSTGPSSSEGKSASSKNALISGLFTTHDFVLPDEASLYKDFFDTMFQELCPAGLLENTLANQIAGAAWRLRRCDLADSDIASHLSLIHISGRSIWRKEKLPPFARSTFRLLSSLISTRSFANSSRSRLSPAFTSQS